MSGDSNTNFRCKVDVPCFSVISDKYKHLTCRLCLCSSGWSGTLCDIQGSVVKKGLTVAAVISDLLRLEVSATDSYPQLVCLECLRKLCEFQTFKESCLSAKATFEMGLQANSVLIHPIVPEGQCGVHAITPEMTGSCKAEDTIRQHPNIPTEENGTGYNFNSELIIKEEFAENSNLKDPLSLEPEQKDVEQDLGERVTIKEEEFQNCSMQFGTNERGCKSKEYSFSGLPSICEAKVLGTEKKLEGNDDKAKSKKISVNHANESERIDDAAKSWKCETCNKFFSEYKRLMGHNRVVHEGIPNFWPKRLSKPKHLAKPKKPLECILCPMVFFSRKVFKNHMIIHTGIYPHNCEWCELGFLEKKSAVQHAKIHAGPPYKCDNCGIEFRFKRLVSEHIKKEHSVCKMKFSGKRKRHFKTKRVEKNFHCEFCSLRFSSQESLESHMSFHKPNLRIKCKLCLRTFPDESSLQNHLPYHDTENFKFKCDWCERKFFTQNIAMVHAKVHVGAPFKCDNCGLEFILKSLISKHIQRMHMKKQYSCKLCKKSYFSQSYLKKHHHRCHSKKSFSCGQCSRMFHYEEALQKHQKVHNRVHRFDCKFCHISYLSEALYQRHMSFHSEDVPFACDGCGKEFTFKRRLIAHIRRVHMDKQHSCSLCFRKFSIVSDLKQHMTLHTKEKNYMCEVCGKTFRQKQGLRVHKITHTGEKPYCCDKCNKRFTQRSSLTTHIKLYCKNVSDQC